MANQIVDMTDWPVGKLTVLRPTDRRDSRGGYFWLCSCECGNEKEVSGSNLRGGTTTSCGCEARRLSSERRKTAAKPPQKCLVPGCASLVGRSGAKGMCGAHYMRVKRYGDPEYLTPEDTRRANNRLAQQESRPAQPMTYYKLHGRHEHRVVAEEKIRRKLIQGEVVHHIDGDRHNNDPANLQVMSAADHLREHLPDLLRRRKAKHGY